MRGLLSSRPRLFFPTTVLPRLTFIPDPLQATHEFRNKFGKLRVTPKEKGLTVENYLVRLIKAMIREDQDVVGLNNSRTKNSSAEYMRMLPFITSSYTNPKEVALKAELTQHICILATPKEVPVYVQLLAKY
jgi:hypothetical protein